MKRRLDWCNAVNLFVVLILTAFIAAGCGDHSSGPVSPPANSSQETLSLVAGSECKALQPLFDQFAKENNVSLNVQYAGSLQISQDLDSDTPPPADAYMPSNSLWLNLGDTRKRVKNIKSVARTYVVFGIKQSVAKRLGWIGKPVNVEDILQAVQTGKIRYMMTSATQSNSGASAYFGYLYAFAGHPETLTRADLNKPQVRAKIKAILGTVNRSAGSSGFLQELFLSKYDNYDGMVNYESVIIGTNQILTAQHKEPLQVIYPRDGLAIADYPLGYVDHGDAAKAALFTKLQDFLLSSASQTQIASLGWRTSPIGMQVTNADPKVFNPNWGVETKRVFSPIRFPDAETIRLGLDLYQTSFRKPSFTIYCLDNSGSMGDNGGSDQLKAGMRQILDQDLARRQLLQASSGDVTIVIPFSDSNIAEWRVEGNDPAKLQNLLANVNALDPNGGTNFYGALARALAIFQACPNLKTYSPAIILMTDGHDNQGGHNDFENTLHAASSSIDVPIYSIAFGNDADKTQLSPLADETSGKVFDGSGDLKSAFREVKGYN